MSFSQMMTGLRKKYEGKIVFMKAGAFYIAIGSDMEALAKLRGAKDEYMFFKRKSNRRSRI